MDTEGIIRKRGCLRCGHIWFPNSEKEPKVCPKCKSPYWNMPKKGELIL